MRILILFSMSIAMCLLVVVCFFVQAHYSRKGRKRARGIVSHPTGFRTTHPIKKTQKKKKGSKKGARFFPFFAGSGISLENKAEQKTVDCPLKTPQKGVKKGRRREIVKKNRQNGLFLRFRLTSPQICAIIANAA